jgi:hypothetical protein
MMYHEATVKFGVEGHGVGTPTCPLQALLYGSLVSNEKKITFLDFLKFNPKQLLHNK